MPPKLDVAMMAVVKGANHPANVLPSEKVLNQHLATLKDQYVPGEPNLWRCTGCDDSRVDVPHLRCYHAQVERRGGRATKTIRSPATYCKDCYKLRFDMPHTSGAEARINPA